MRRLNLQLFNDGEGEATPPQAQTQEVAITQEAVESWLGTEEGQRFLQPKLDSYHTKGLQTHLEKNKDKYISKDVLESLKQENESKISELNVQLEQNKIQSKLQSKLLGEGANPKKLNLIMKLADISKLKLDGDDLLGANDLITGLKTDAGEFFGESRQTNTGKAGDPPQGNPIGGETEDPVMTAFKKAMGV